MTAPPPPQPPPTSGPLLPVLAAVTYLASVIAVFGFLSLFLGRDVIELGDAGPLLGPLMVVAAAVVTVLALVRLTDRPGPWRSALLTIVAVYVAMLGVGALAYSLGRGQPLWFVFFIAEQAASPFVIAAAVLAGGFVGGLWMLVRRMTAP